MRRENLSRLWARGYSAIDLIVLAVIVVSILLWGVTRFSAETVGESEFDIHRHPPGAHGGVIASLAEDRFHAEG